jgi:hypothetical protein
MSRRFCILARLSPAQSAIFMVLARHVRGRVLGQKFAQQIAAHSPGEAHGGSTEDQVRSAIRRGIVKIRECSRAHVPQHLRIVGLCAPTIAACEKCGAHRMQQPRLNGAGALIVVARILVKQRGEDRVSQKIAAPPVRKFCRKTFAVSCRALPVSGKGVVRLLDARSDAHTEHSHWIERAACRE